MFAVWLIHPAGYSTHLTASNVQRDCTSVRTWRSTVGTALFLLVAANEAGLLGPFQSVLALANASVSEAVVNMATSGGFSAKRTWELLNVVAKLTMFLRARHRRGTRQYSLYREQVEKVM